MQKVSKARARQMTSPCECDSDPEANCPVMCCKDCGLYGQCTKVCDAFLTPVYTGRRKTAGNMASGVVVTKDGEYFPPIPSQVVNNHSSEFNWGFYGSSCAQLSLALLLDVTGDPELAQRQKQKFKFDVVAEFKDTWQITGDEIKQWLHKEGANISAAGF